MDVKFFVHGVSTAQVAATVQLDGVDVRAAIPGYEVELTSEDGRHGSITLRFVGADVADAMMKFKTGEVVTWTL